jgi:hypothetical protein
LLPIRWQVDLAKRYTALAKRFPPSPASAGIIWTGDWGQLTEAAFLRDFAGDIPVAKASVLYSVQSPFQRELCKRMSESTARKRCNV